MIEVKVTFSKKTYKSGRENFIYKDISVTGHSSDGTINSIKCCAGVTAITCGLVNLINGEEGNTIEINKGYFHFHSIRYYDEINYAINALVFQLDNISCIYPQFFKDFQFIEVKENGEN